jgi:hypothetical protein
MAETPDQRPDDMSPDTDRSELPPDLWPLHERLVTDGARWRRRAPDGRALPAWARATLINTPSVRDLADGGRRERQFDAHDEHPSRPKGPHPRMDSPYNTSPTRWRAIAGGLAATVVVGLLAALLVHNGAQRGGTAKATATPAPPRCTVTPPPEAPIGPDGCLATPQPANNPGTFFQPGQLPVVAPSDPQIVYRIQAGAPSRSTDGGKTYTAVSKPKTDISPIDDESFTVSPLDASHVFLTISGAKSGQMCVVGQSGQAYHGGTLFSGSTDCSEQFYSADSGQTWTRLRLPGGVVLGGTNLFRVVQGPYESTMYVIQAQGSRLYAGAGFETQGGAILASLGARILTSTNGGATWTLVDQPLANAGLYVCDFAASPSGSTIYAAVTNQSCGNEGLPAMGLWRSDNAGQSWSTVSSLPSPAEGGMLVAPSGALYIFEPAASPVSHSMNVSQTARYALVSVNGGATFSHAPTAGIPGDPSKVALIGPVAMLSDGSALYAVQAGAGGGLYAWKLGDASWAKVAALPGATLGAALTIPNPAGGDTLVIVDAGANITTVSVSR